MHLLLVGISHRTAPIELRERVDFHARGLEHALRTLAARSQQGGELAVLSTCNRAELYAAVASGAFAGKAMHMTVMHDDACTPARCVCSPEFIVQDLTVETCLAGQRAQASWERGTRS